MLVLSSRNLPLRKSLYTLIRLFRLPGLQKDISISKSTTDTSMRTRSAYFALETHVFQIHRPQFRRCTEQRRTKDDTQIANRHVVDLLHAADSVMEATWLVSKQLMIKGQCNVLVKMTHEMFEGSVIGIRQFIDLFVQPDMSESIVLIPCRRI